MITYRTDKNIFSFRSVAVAMDEDHVLLHKAVKDEFWALPGGRVELFEVSQDTVVREMKEEIGVDVEVVRSLWHAESFFEIEGYYYHELGHYYLVNWLTDAFKDKTKTYQGIEENEQLIFKWFRLSELKTLSVFPNFIKEGLLSLPQHLETVIDHQGKVGESLIP